MGSSSRRCFIFAFSLALLVSHTLFGGTSPSRHLQGNVRTSKAPSLLQDQALPTNSEPASKQSDEPELETLPNVLLMHMGKAGGTTVKLHTKQHWRLVVQECHPNPCRANIANQPNVYLIPTLRDPVDRFVSAFYWRIERLCADIPKAQRIHGEYAGCQTWDKPNVDLIDMLYRRRQKNVSLLAQDLCSTNDTIRAVAERDVGRILHVKPQRKQTIVGWFDFDWQNKMEKIYPLILEKKGTLDFALQVDMAVQWYYNQTHFENPATFARRSDNLSKRNNLKNGTNYRSSSNVKQPLTPDAERCLENYYAKDYEMLGVIQHQLCKTTYCREAMQNILQQRGYVLNKKDDPSLSLSL